ncbi:MAG: transcription termination factor NusA [bacterium]|nr:transcription termination factor NusA [bacterium]
MILIENFQQVTAQIESERGIKANELVEAIELALVSACRRKYTEEARLEAKLDTTSGEAKIFIVKTVVSEVEDDEQEITKKDASAHVDNAKVGEDIWIEITPNDFGRIAAQTAKQVIIQRIREAEKNTIYDEFSDKIGSIVVGTVQKVEGRNYLINLGRIEALLTPYEQIPGETFQVKEKIKLYVSDVERTPKGPIIRISRGHPGLLRCLFHMEVPEIQDGIIEIISISREPGKRAKVAVKSNNPAIGAVGTCVGHMGGRIQTIIKEIGNEKIDILEWNEDPTKYIANSLKPAKISDVKITNEEKREACVTVPKDQLSLAIGKGGVNVRLAVKLTNWKLDITSEEGEDSSTSLVEKMQQNKETETIDTTEAIDTSGESSLAARLAADSAAEKQSASDAEAVVEETVSEEADSISDAEEQTEAETQA